MDKTEAMEIIENELAVYRHKSYAELNEMIGAEPITKEITSNTGIKYQIEIMAHWDDNQDEDIRVHGCIDDMGWRAYFPLSSDFIMSPNGKFVDENNA
jgi:hypothetical protein